MENEEDMDSIEFYLRTLRKKVDHQLKNPFQLAFSSYTFEELLNWKNNVLQLDATSRLYGQRVDFLHTGTLHILGSVVNIEQQPQQSSEKKESIKEQGKQSIVENIFEKHLQNPERLNGLPPSSDSNFLQWRQIMRKRDTLPLLMLNQLSMTPSLMLALVSEKQQPLVYEPVFGQESIYLKMINFAFLDPEKCFILSEMEEVISEIDYFLMNMGKGKREHPRDAFNIDSYMEFDFPLISQSKKIGFQSAERQQNLGQTSLMHDDFQCQYENPEGIMANEPSEMGEFQSQVFSVYSIDTQSTKTAKERRPIIKKKSKKKRDFQKCEYIQFSGINPNREDVLATSQPPEDLFLTRKDHLHLRFIRYNPPFNLRIRNKGRRSLMRPSSNLFNNEASKVYLDCSFQSQDPYEFNTPLLIENLSTAFSKKSQLKFKEAPLPLKQLKKKIREVGIDKEIRLSEIRAAFSNEEPLDIFISVLHIAAEDGLMIVK